MFKTGLAASTETTEAIVHAGNSPIWGICDVDQQPVAFV